MGNMSRKATNEYIGTRRRAYAQADRAKRMRILDEVCETTGYEAQGPRKDLRRRRRRSAEEGLAGGRMPLPAVLQGGGGALGGGIRDAGRAHQAGRQGAAARHERPHDVAPAFRGGQGEARMGKGQQAIRARSAQRGQGQHAMCVRGSRHGLQRPAGRRADRHLRPRRRRPLGQLLLDPRRHGPKDAVDTSSGSSTARTERRSGRSSARRGTGASMRRWRR